MFDSVFCNGLHIVMDAQVATLMERCPRKGGVNAVPSPAAHSRTPIQGNDPGKEVGATAQKRSGLSNFLRFGRIPDLDWWLQVSPSPPRSAYIQHTYGLTWADLGRERRWERIWKIVLVVLVVVAILVVVLVVTVRIIV